MKQRKGRGKMNQKRRNGRGKMNQKQRKRRGKMNQKQRKGNEKNLWQGNKGESSFWRSFKYRDRSNQLKSPFQVSLFPRFLVVSVLTDLGYQLTRRRMTLLSTLPGFRKIAELNENRQRLLRCEIRSSTFWQGSKDLHFTLYGDRCRLRISEKRLAEEFLQDSRRVLRGLLLK